MDTIVTFEGRRQIANADLRIEYVSFTDAGSHYRADIASGSADATTRLYLEAASLPQDQITFEADDSGRLKPFSNGFGVSMKDGQIISYSFDALTASVLTGSNEEMHLLNGDEFASTAGTLLASSIDNFTRLRLIGTRDSLFEDDGFGVGNSNVEFVMNNDRPIRDRSQIAVRLTQKESLFQDVRLSKVINFEYLPPINRTNDVTIDKRDHRTTTKHQLGNYMPWGRTHLDGLSPAQLEDELAYYERLGYARTISFEPTSLNNRLFAQAFELTSNTMTKLDVIDYGQYLVNGQLHHAFFVGKVYVDENDTHTFIHLFTMVFG